MNDRRLRWMWLKGRIIWEVTFGASGHPLPWEKWMYYWRLFSLESPDCILPQNESVTDLT